MLCHLYPKLNDILPVKLIRRFVNSVWYPVLVAALMVLSNIFALELLTFWLYLGFGLVAAFLCEDMRAVIPIGCCGYMTISAENNPAKNIEDAIFYQPYFQVQFIFILVVTGIVLLGRLVFELVTFPAQRKPFPKLAAGLILFGLAMIFGGAFSGYYGVRTAFYGFVELCALSVLYFYFYYAVHWNTVKKGYFASVFLAVGIGIAVEIIYLYLRQDVIIDGTIQRALLYTGWGMYNNIGCVMAMCVAPPLYFAATQKHGWIFSILASVFMLTVALTQSRGSILFGAVAFGLGALLTVIKSKGADRWANLSVFGALFIALIVVAIIYRDKIDVLFGSWPEDTFDPNGRLPTYVEGWKQFKEAPLFGVGFYECHGFRWGSLPPDAFLPPRYHNTYVQILASCGTVGIVAYLFHRAQTLWLFFRRPTVEKTYIALTVASLILMSIVDCHFFNFGPGILYSVLLVCAEGAHKRDFAAIQKKKKEKQKHMEDPA
ncbi:MAG: O-antigen ligase family protein [Clostridiales bacterium]|nr:O-antigen ligase family protein [Clostridiales bacterium]